MCERHGVLGRDLRWTWPAFAVLVLLPTAGCTQAPLEQDAVVRARAPVQADTAARLDRLGLPEVGADSGAVCTAGQDNLVIRDDFRFECAVRELRVVSVQQDTLQLARRDAGRALGRVCGQAGLALPEDQSRGVGTSSGQVECAGLVLDVFLAPPAVAAVQATSVFRPVAPRSSTAQPAPPGLSDAGTVGAPYVLLVVGHRHFYRAPR